MLSRELRAQRSQNGLLSYIQKCNGTRINRHDFIKWHMGKTNTPSELDLDE